MPKPNAPRGAFTVVELMVVIGLIALLMGLALPAINHVKKTAYATNTQQMVARISAAIDHFHSDFRTYPGPLANEQLAPLPPNQTTVSVPAGAPITPTQSENLVLGLMGGLRRDATMSPPLVFDRSQLGQGPLNYAVNPPKRSPSYLEAKPDELSAGQWGPPVTDTLIPEFMDRFPEALPILYLRANIGTPGVVADVTVAGAVVRAQYNIAHLAPYGVMFHPVDFPQTPINNANPACVDAPGFPGSYRYFRSLSFPNQPHQKDAFILLSAGRDRIYGTKDDICNFGSPGQ